MVEFLLFLILLVLLFGASRVLGWGITIGAWLIVAVIAVLAIGLGMAALGWGWSWARSSSDQIPVALGAIVCGLIALAGYGQAASDEDGPHRRVLGGAIIVVAGVAFFSTDYVSSWSWLFVIVGAAAGLAGFFWISDFAWWIPQLRKASQRVRQAVQIVIWYLAIAAFGGGAYGGVVAAQWLRFFNYLAPPA